MAEAILSEPVQVKDAVISAQHLTKKFGDETAVELGRILATPNHKLEAFARRQLHQFGPEILEDRLLIVRFRAHRYVLYNM